MSSKRISEADIEEAFEDIIGESLPGEANASSLFISGVTVLAAVAIFGIFVAGKRSGKLLSTVVEIKWS